MSIGSPDEPGAPSPPPERGRSTREARRVGVTPSHFNRTTLKTATARRLRRDSTRVEMQLWQKLRNRQLGVDFRRQHPAGPFVLDFYCPSLRLAIELDGGPACRSGQPSHRSPARSMAGRSRHYGDALLEFGRCSKPGRHSRSSHCQDSRTARGASDPHPALARRPSPFQGEVDRVRGTAEASAPGHQSCLNETELLGHTS
jgi:uncharacterized protein DUF559